MYWRVQCRPRSSIYACIHEYIHIYKHTYIQTYIQTYPHTYTHATLFLQDKLSAALNLLDVYIHTYINIIYLHTYIHTHIHTHKPLSSWQVQCRPWSSRCWLPPTWAPMQKVILGTGNGRRCCWQHLSPLPPAQERIGLPVRIIEIVRTRTKANSHAHHEQPRRSYTQRACHTHHLSCLPPVEKKIGLIEVELD